MNEQSEPSLTGERALHETSTPRAFSFIVRIWRHDGKAGAGSRGWIEDVESRQRTAFLGLDQLPSVIARYLGMPARGADRWQVRLRRWRAGLARWLARGGKA